MGQGEQPMGYPPPVSYGPPQPEYPPSGGGGYPQAGYAQQPPAGYPMPGSYPPPQAHPLPHMAPQAGPHHKPPPPGNFSGYDQEAAQAAANAGSFAEALVRKQFVRKVFSLVFLQLCITIGVASCFIFVDAVREYVRPGGDGQWVFIVSWVLSLVMLIGLTCSTRIRRKHPWNLVALFAFTLVESVLVGTICAYWQSSVVLEAFAVTGAAVAGLTLVAGHILGMAAGVVLMVLLVTLLIGFFYVNKWWYLAISVVVALLFAAFLMVMGGRANAISPDEYVYASVQIYMDIIIIFLQFLNIMGIAQS
ncbi:Protein lifeguard 1 [Chlorella vulgaris]